MGTSKEEQLFGNFFNTRAITSPRILNFGDDAVGRMASDNGDGRFTSFINSILDTGLALRSEVSDVDVAITLQKGATLNINKIVSGFQFTMSNTEGAIAYALGGRDTAAYLQFYPKGISEYSKASKTQMPMLTERVYDAAVANKPALPDPLYSALIVYKQGWIDARTAQELKKGAVADDRDERDSNRIAFEYALLQAVHFVAGYYPGNIDKCSQYFNFSILYSAPKHAHEILSGKLAVGETKTVVNRRLSPKTTLIFRNQDANAPYAVWSGSSATTPMPDKPLVINENESKELKPAEIGNDAINTFILIKNLHPTNAGKYEVEIAGPQPKDDGEE